MRDRSGFEGSWQTPINRHMHKPSQAIEETRHAGIDSGLLDTNLGLSVEERQPQYDSALKEFGMQNFMRLVQ